MKQTLSKFGLPLLIAAAVAAAGCVAPVRPQKTPLELQAIQSREFETTKKVAFAATMTVFQDLGYTIISADIKTGFISAKSPTRLNYGFNGNVMTDTKATAFIEEIKGKTKVRLNFVESCETSADQGVRTLNDTPVEDGQLYQNAFTRIQEGIFVRAATN